jgi:hypothetical protein
MAKEKRAEKKKKTAQIHSPHVTCPVGLARQYWNRREAREKNPLQGEEKKGLEGVISS